MTSHELEAAVQAHFGDYSAEFLARIRDALPVALTRFCSEWQWEFLDKYTTFSTKTSTGDASGKTVFSLPSDYYKIVALWTANHRIEYLSRTEWADWQRYGVSSQEPLHYTVIGKELVLTADSDGSTVYAIYTRDSSKVQLADIPAQYHYAVEMALVEFLAPALVQVDDRTIPNPDGRFAAREYRGAVQEARIIESRSKGRAKRLIPADHIRRVNDY